MNKRFSKFIFFLMLLSEFIFFSCEVGLGEAVDTEAPKLTIDYPEAKAIVRDGFVLAGTCSDDIAVTKVVVSILDEKNKTVTGYDFKQPVVETTIEEKQFWSVTLNEQLQDGTYPLKDGKYTFRAVAYDGAGRKSGELERDLEIDNTAPVFIINSPGSISTESSFGSVFKIEGSIAENHTVKEMNLTIFDADGTKIAEWQQENINTAGGTTVTFAKYYSDSEKQDPLFDRYKEIYGNSSGFKSFSCSVKLMDNALTYKKPDFVPSYNDDSRGEIDTGTNYNTTTNLWLYDDIYGTDAKFKLMGNAAKAEWGKDFEIKDFMNYLNGTDSYEQKNSNGKSVVEVLNEAKINTEDTRLKFKLNKDANPTYTIMGYSFDSTAQTEGIYSLSPAAKGGTITFKADAGLDGVLFSPSTIKVYMFGPFEAIQVPSALSEIYSSPDIYASAPENQKITTKLYDGENGIPGADKDVAGPYEGESRTTWTQSLNLPSDSTIMKATKYYIIAASGCDKDNVDMISLNYKYNGFIAQATGVPPTVTIKEPEKDSISNAENEILIFKGDVISEEGTAINDVSYEISVYDTLEKNKFLGTIKNIDSAGNRSDSLKVNGTLGESPSVSFEIDAAKGFWQSADGISIDGTKPPLNSAYKYTLTVTGVTDTKGTDSISVTLDKKLPSAELEISTLLSNANGEKDNCVNGKIKIKGTLSDNDKIASAWAEISDSKGNVTKSDVQPEGTGSFTWDFDTTLLSDNTEYSVKVYALDRAGNKGSSSEQKIYVDQSTDLPVITLSNADKNFKDKPSLSSNLFGMGSNVIIGAVSDDDGISSIEYVIDEGTENEIRGTIDMSGKTPTSKSFQIDLTKLLKDGKETVISSGDHTLSIVATDISSGLQNIPTPVKSRDETGVSKMAFGYDDDVPSLSVTTKSGELIGKDISYSITGTASDGSGLKKNSEGKSVIFRYAIDTSRHGEKYGTKEKPVEILVAEDGTWTDMIKTDGNGDEFEYRAEDEYERSTTAKFIFKIDSVKPTIKIETPSEETIYIGDTKLYSFRGTADDPTKVIEIVEGKEVEKTVDSSGISGIKYTVYASDGTKIETKTVDSSTQWNININLSDYKNGEEINVSKIEFISVDGGGLESEPVSRNIVIDKVAPSIKFTIDGIEKNGTETLYINKEPEFIFEVSDENLKFDSISCSLPLDWHLQEQTETYVKYKISGLAAESVASQSKNYSFTAQDKAGRITERTLNVYCDKDLPVIAEPSVSPIASKEGDTTEYVNGFVTLKGTVSDIDKVQSTKIILKQNGSDVTSGDTLILVNNTGDRYEYKIDTTKLSDALLDIIIESTDRAGNLSSKTKTVTVDQDTDKPVLKFSNGDVTITDENAIQVGKNLFGMGSNTLYINISDDDGIQSVLLNVDGNSESLLTDGKSTTWSTSKDVSKYGSGVHSLKFTITDTEGKTVSYPENDSDTIKIAFDDDVPEISVTKLGSKDYTPECFAVETFDLTGTIKDSSGNVTIYLKENSSESECTVVQNCQTVKEWNDKNVVNTSGDKVRTYIARDKYGRQSSVTIQYKVDTIKPVFNSGYISITGETASGSKTYPLSSYNPSYVWFTNSSFSIKGGDGSSSSIPVTEDNNFTIQLKVNENIVSTLQPGANNSFSGTVEVGTEGNSAKTITLIATDEAGNQSSPVYITVNVDKTIPQVITKAIFVEDPSNQNAQSISDGDYVNKDKIYIKYEASDDVSGISKVEVFKSAAMKEEECLGNSSNAEGILEINISNFVSKEYDFYVKVTDKAGNTTSSDLVNFTFDKTAPTVTYSKPSENSNVNKTISIEGTISDLNPQA
ncbi:MAG: Ig-like domain repeat protein, partial [Treponema sp.]|nr:Ig-like domain repeat protein [Treponema sp.]